MAEDHVLHPSEPSEPSQNPHRPPSSAGNVHPLPRRRGSWPRNEPEGPVFHTRATDARGHSAEFRVRFPPEVAGRIATLIERKEIPVFHTTADLIRHATVAFLENLGATSPNLAMRVELQEFVAQLATAERFAAIQRELAWHERFLVDLLNVCQTALKNEDWLALREILDEMEESADALRDPYRGRALSTIREYRARLPERFRPS